MASTSFTPLPVAPVDGQPLDDVESLRSVSATSDGGYVVLWSGATGTATATVSHIYLQRFDAAGQKLGGEVRLPTPTAGASATALADGSVVLAWTASAPLAAADPSIVRSGVYSQRFDAAGKPSGPVTEVYAVVQDMRLVEQAKFFSGHQVLLLDDGSYVVGWYAATGPINRWSTAEAQAQRFEADGTRRGSTIEVGDSQNQMAGFQAGVEGDTFISTLLAMGGPAASFRYDRFDDATAQRVPGDTDGMVPAGSMLLPLEGGRYLLWQAPHISGVEPSTRFLGTDGLPQGPVLAGVSMPATTLALGDGGFLTLRSNFGMGITAQRYDAQGNPMAVCCSLAAVSATTNSGPQRTV